MSIATGKGVQPLYSICSVILTGDESMPAPAKRPGETLEKGFPGRYFQSCREMSFDIWIDID